MSTSNILHAKTRRREDAKKEKQKNSDREQGAGAFLCFGPLGSHYWRRNFPVTHLNCFLFFASKPNRFIAFLRIVRLVSNNTESAMSIFCFQLPGYAVAGSPHSFGQKHSPRRRGDTVSAFISQLRISQSEFLLQTAIETATRSGNRNGKMQAKNSGDPMSDKKSFKPWRMGAFGNFYCRYK
jgi:hypothetical protein